jgi:hypothetical protein
MSTKMNKIHVKVLILTAILVISLLPVVAVSNYRCKSSIFETEKEVFKMNEGWELDS